MISYRAINEINLGAWQGYGDRGYEARLDHAMNLAQYFEQKIVRDGNAFVLVHPRSFTNVCFWWVPPGMRPFKFEGATEQHKADLGMVSTHAAFARVDGTTVCRDYSSVQVFRFFVPLTLALSHSHASPLCMLILQASSHSVIAPCQSRQPTAVVRVQELCNERGSCITGHICLCPCETRWRPS